MRLSRRRRWVVPHTVSKVNRQRRVEVRVVRRPESVRMLEAIWRPVMEHALVVVTCSLQAPTVAMCEDAYDDDVETNSVSYAKSLSDRMRH
eukprot:6196564-Pleurochrysis_carterae.AAC.6